MSFVDPMAKHKEEFKETIQKIGANNSVGIDPQLTHAIIIDYLQQLNKRLEHLEEIISAKK